MPSIDFTDVGEPEEWTPAPSGEYILELIDAEETTTKGGKNPGTPMTKLKFEIVDCEGELEKYNGRTVWNNAVESKEALPVLKQMLRAFGAEIPENQPLEWDWDELIGTQVRAKLRSVPARKDKNDPTREYPPKNEISRWLVSDDEE
jgi:hypothetical protein